MQHQPIQVTKWLIDTKTTPMTLTLKSPSGWQTPKQDPPLTLDTDKGEGNTMTHKPNTMEEQTGTILNN